MSWQTRLDKWFWKHLGRRGTMVFNVALLATAAALVAVAFQYVAGRG